MDLALYVRVLWRFKYIVIAGFLAAVTLTFLSIASVSYDHGSLKFRYRQSETWQAQSTLLITQSGFPWGRSVVPVQIPAASSAGTTVIPRFSDPSRFSGLAMLYARLANSDAVHQIVLRDGPIHGKIDAQPIFTSSASNATTLPMMTVSGLAATPVLARSIATRVTDAFIAYLDQQQAASGIPTDQRVIVQEVNQPRKSLLIAGRKKTLPVLIFVTIMTIAIGLAFILENLRPRGEVKPPSQVATPTKPESQPETLQPARAGGDSGLG